MKKIVALLLVAMLSLSFAVTGFAAAEEQPDLSLTYGSTKDGTIYYMVPKSTVKIMLGVWGEVNEADFTAMYTPANITNGAAAPTTAVDKLAVYYQSMNSFDKDFLSKAYTVVNAGLNGAGKAIDNWRTAAQNDGANKFYTDAERTLIIALDHPTATQADVAKLMAKITPKESEPAYDALVKFFKADSDLNAFKAWARIYYFCLIDPINAGKNSDEGYMKFSPKITKGAEFISSWEIKKSGTKELYLEVKAKENYFGGLKDVQIETKVTFSKPTKTYDEKFFFAHSLKAGERLQNLDNNDYFYDTRDFKYGWGPVYDLSDKAAAHTFSAPANKSYDDRKPGKYGQYLINSILVAPGHDAPSDSSASGSGSKFVHFKKGNGEVYDFDFDTAYFEVKLEDNADFNLYYTGAAIKEVTAAYPDADFEFFCFRGQPAFDFTAAVELYTDEDTVGEEPYLYIWDGATLSAVKNEFEDGTFYVKTRQLGNYVVSSEELEIKAVETTAEAPATTAPSTPSTANPATGVADFVGVAVALALVSVAAAGAVALKK